MHIYILLSIAYYIYKLYIYIYIYIYTISCFRGGQGGELGGRKHGGWEKDFLYVLSEG